jgi:predicted GH43/DUF377 family glycosyl hydrolase
MRNFVLIGVMLVAVLAGGGGCAVSGRGEGVVPREEEMGAYLLVYFKDDTHGLYFAVSRDGYSFTDVNGGRPVMEGTGLAEQKGIRDPHMVRGPDGAFYMAMTDLHLFAKKEGHRETEWQRPGEQYGWGNNRALVMMKSEDLIHWSHTIYRLDLAFDEMKDIGCAWAPQTIYDAKAGKMMVYFTTRFGAGPNKLYYAYADEDFTKFVTVPKELFAYPREKVNVIDADITKVGEKFHMFYVAHEDPGGIRHAVSDKINRDYDYQPARVDEARVNGKWVACEAPNVWKRTGKDTYVLMYDVFGVKPHNFGFVETKDFQTYTDIGRFNEGVMKATNFSSPKHGTVIPITEKEAERLEKRWGSGQ